MSDDTAARGDEQLLGSLGSRRRLNLGGLTLAGRRRRPSGEKPPLPRDLRTSGRLWIGLGALMTVLWVTLFTIPGTTDWWTEVDLSALAWLVDRRTDGMTNVMELLHALGSFWFIRPLRWITIAVLVGFKRWRILFGALLAFVIVDGVLYLLTDAIARSRPFVEIIGEWQGYSHPSAPVAILGVTLVAVGLALIPKGRLRRPWWIVSGALLTLLAISRMYLGVDHPSDAVVGAILGPAVGVIVFKLAAPEAIFPVNYHRGRSAHLDVTGRRGDAIRTALQEQLGLTVTTLEPFGLEGSGGSTPLRVTVADGDDERYLFAKLYARSHLRADRWYKVARTILYGSLEDEVRFTSVRRLVEYEDYMLLKLREAGLPSPEPFGFVEIMPEVEYLIVTEFLDGALEIGDTDITDEIIDDALSVSRRLWDAGLAHRDIKPANVMVREGQVVLIDPAFATVRPSPWRQAVDLANMLIILALRSSPEHVYERALEYFSPDDIAEAFAATRGVTIPTQSRSSLSLLKKTTGVDIVERFQELSPRRDRISIQRWSLRRVWLAAVAGLAIAIFISLVVDNIMGAGFI
jgi:membrane-associated phospholipid phosphatase/tRNA A-37 threonylcarbamoyl transferase component Bud32